MHSTTSVDQPVTAYDDEKNPPVIEVETAVLSTTEDRKLVRRIDLCLCPLMALSMTLQFMDKQALPAASILGIIQDLASLSPLTSPRPSCSSRLQNLSGGQYSWSSSIFYFGYLASTYATPYLMVRLPIGKLLSCTFMGWAIIIGCHATVKNFGGLMAVRALLGAVEAAVIPGFSLLTGMFYKRQEHALRHGFWYLGSALGIMLAGCLSFGIAHIKSGIGAWKWLFVTLAVVTFMWASLMFWLLPDTPRNAFFLSEDQKVHAVERLRSNQMVVKNNHFQWYQAREALLDPRIWLNCLFLICMSICSSAIATFSQIVLVGLGFNVYQANLFIIALGGVTALFGISATYICSRYENIRCITNIVLCALSLMGALLVQFGPNLGSQLFGLLMYFAYPCTVAIAFSMIASNVAGFTKKSVATSMATLGYCIGNMIGPFLFFPREKPRYPSGFTATASCFGIGIILMVFLIVVTRYENSRRDKIFGVVDQSILSVVEEEVSTTDLTDGENSSFRYMM